MGSRHRIIAAPNLTKSTFHAFSSHESKAAQFNMRVKHVYKIWVAGNAFSVGGHFRV